MDGYQYEQKCAELLKGRGFINVNVTPGSGDQGVDIFAEKDSVKWAVQCKYYEGAVGNKAVQEVFAGACFYDCDKALIITNSTLTKPAQSLAEKLNVEVWEDINAIVLQQEANSVKSDRVYVNDAQAVAVIEEYLKGEAYERFLSEYPPNDALNQEIEAFVNDMSARIEKIHNELVRSANDPNKASIIESYFENREEFLNLRELFKTKFRWRDNKEDDSRNNEGLLNELKNILFYPYEIEMISDFARYVDNDNAYLERREKEGNEKEEFVKRLYGCFSPKWIEHHYEYDNEEQTKLNKELNNAKEKYKEQISLIIDNAFVEKTKVELDSIEKLVFRFIERGEKEGASYNAMNSLVELLNQMYNCGVVSITTTAKISHIYYFNFLPDLDKDTEPLWREYNLKYDFLRSDKSISLVCQGKKFVAEASRDHVPAEPMIKAKVDERIRLMLLMDKYKENEISLNSFKERIDFYRGQGEEILKKYKQDVILTENELIKQTEAFERLIQSRNSKIETIKQIKISADDIDKKIRNISYSLVKSLFMGQQLSDEKEKFENHKKQLINEIRELKQLERETEETIRIVEKYKKILPEMKARVEELEVDLLTADYKENLNQAEYDKQEKILKEIQEAIDNNHRDFLFENYGDILYGIK